MWPDRRLLDLFKTEHPIVLAPIAGAMDTAGSPVWSLSGEEPTWRDGVENDVTDADGSVSPGYRRVFRVISPARSPLPSGLAPRPVR